DALHGLAGGGGGEVEAHGAPSATVYVGGRAWDERDVFLPEGLGEQVLRIDEVGKRRPDEEPAPRLRPLRLPGEELRERVEHRISPAAVERAELVHVPEPGAVGEVALHELLRERGGAQVGGLL